MAPSRPTCSIASRRSSARVALPARSRTRPPLPVPRPLANTVVGALWFAQVAEAPPSFFDYLQYVCVADGEHAKKTLGFRPLYTSREALIDYAGAQHLRDVKLLSETPA